MMKDLLEEVRAFIQQVYVPDVAAIGAMYAAVARLRRRGDQLPRRARPAARHQGDQVRPSGGTIFDGDLGGVKTITSFQDPYFRDNVSESIAHAWYDGDWASTRTTRTRFRSTPTSTRRRNTPGSRPPFSGAPDAGGAARTGAGRLRVRPRAHQEVRRPGAHHRRSDRQDQTGPAVLHSTLGRHAARAIRAAVLCDLALKHLDLLIENIGKGDVVTFNPPTSRPSSAASARLRRPAVCSRTGS